MAATQADQLTDLMARLAAGDREALQKLYDATCAKLFGVCLRILADRDESEDVLQEVYLTIWRRADRFDASRASVITWMSAIARNRAIDRLRTRGPMARAESVDGLDMADESPAADDLLAAAEDRGRLLNRLEDLDERTRGAIRTAFFDGLTYEALAARVGAPLGTVKSWIRRGLLRLKGCLER